MFNQVAALRPKIFVLCLLVGGLITQAKAYETDQYSYYDIPLRDSTEILNKVVNRGIAKVARTWEGERDDLKFANRVARLFNSRQLEKWVNISPQIDRAGQKLKSVYRTTGMIQSPIIRSKGLAATFKLNDVHVGADKMSHFFGVGGILYRLVKDHYYEGDGEEQKRKALLRALAHSRFTERAYWGKLTTNVYSNADLVVNYEGLLFLKSLSEDGVVAGKKSIIKWVNNRPVVQRDFDFSDHVNDFWSEALNPNVYQTLLSKRVVGVLQTYCANGYYKRHKDKLVSSHESELRERYEILELDEKALEFRMDRVCDNFQNLKHDKREKVLEKQVKLQSKFKEKMKDQEHISEAPPALDDVLDSGNFVCQRRRRKAQREHRTLVKVHKNTSSRHFRSLRRTAQSWKQGHMAGLLEVASQLYQSTSFRIRAAQKWGKDGRELHISHKGSPHQEILMQWTPQKESESSYARACIVQDLTFPQDIDVRNKTTLKLYHCVYTTQSNAGLREESYYLYGSKGDERLSLEGAYGLRNAKNYIYRTVPMLCRWY